MLKKKKKSQPHDAHPSLHTKNISHAQLWSWILLEEEEEEEGEQFFVIKSSTLLTDIFLDRYTMLEKRIQIGQVANMNAVQSHHLDSQLCDNFN